MTLRSHFRLFIDTSIHQRPFAALFHRDKLLWQSKAHENEENTWDFLEATYQSVKKELSQNGEEGFCEKLHLGLGPGSFVGIRQGLSFAQALLCSSGCSLSFFSSLELLFSSSCRDQIVFRDARSGGVYLQRKKRGVVSAPCRVSLEEVADLWKKTLEVEKDQKNTVFWGSSQQEREKLAQRFEEASLLDENLLAQWRNGTHFCTADPVNSCMHLNLISEIESVAGDKSISFLETAQCPEPYYLQPTSHYRAKSQ